VLLGNTHRVPGAWRPPRVLSLFGSCACWSSRDTVVSLEERRALRKVMPDVGVHVSWQARSAACRNVLPVRVINVFWCVPVDHSRLPKCGTSVGTCRHLCTSLRAGRTYYVEAVGESGADVVWFSRCRGAALGCGGTAAVGFRGVERAPLSAGWPPVRGKGLVFRDPPFSPIPPSRSPSPAPCCP